MSEQYVEKAQSCEVHVPGRDRPSPWCAACRMAAAPALPTCWRSECRNGCYYPDVCSERASSGNGSSPGASA